MPAQLTVCDLDGASADCGAQSSIINLTAAIMVIFSAVAFSS